MIVPPDDRISSALTGIGSRLEGVAARTLGLTLALGLAGWAGLLTYHAAAAALGFTVGGGLMISRVIVRDALERAGWHDPAGVGDSGNDLDPSRLPPRHPHDLHRDLHRRCNDGPRCGRRRHGDALDHGPGRHAGSPGRDAGRRAAAGPERGGAGRVALAIGLAPLRARDARSGDGRGSGEGHRRPHLGQREGRVIILLG